ncbi:hypothetical protein AAVH_01498 [Aphelenchoides avenae]|nr:hypothetical protein AAVH_01498 [Aphelenchus avenae]
MQQLTVLEKFTGTQIRSFGEYKVTTINDEGYFALKIIIDDANGCDGMQEFTTKVVSFSQEVEKAKFTCHCGPYWVISKVR